MTTTWAENNNATHDFEAAKCLKKHVYRSYNWTTLINTSKNRRTRKNPEAIYFIGKNFVGKKWRIFRHMTKIFTYE